LGRAVQVDESVVTLDSVAVAVVNPVAAPNSVPAMMARVLILPVSKLFKLKVPFGTVPAAGRQESAPLRSARSG
jgi:hypothetical protein